MTIEELLNEVKDLEWNTDIYGQIRCAAGDCPIIAYARKKDYERYRPYLHNMAANSIGTQLGLTFGLIQNVIRAADNSMLGESRELRLKMEKVLLKRELV